MLTVDDAAAHLGFATTPVDPGDVQRVLDAARGVIEPHLAEGPWSVEQAQVLDHCILRVVSELWAARSTPTGSVTFADGSEGFQPVLRDAYWAVEANLQRAGLTRWPAVLA